jgi:peptidoglycan hydrolase-like protein with peptidoglycan-binding domain
MLAQSRALLGTAEHPPGSNHNFITEWYGFDSPWCDMAVSYAAARSGNLDAVMGRFAWTPAHAWAFWRAGRWHYGIGGIRAGDVVFFDWSGTRSIDNIDHVGVVEAVRAEGTIITLEGNTADAFLRRVRNAACIVGYGRPAYDDAAPMPKTDGVLRRGSTGTAVVTLQRNLNVVLGSQLSVDGVFGPATQAAVQAFQTRYNLGVDGEYGPQSAAMMKAALAGQPMPRKPTPKPPSPPALAVDGAFGPATCAALQRALNGHGAHLVVDGVFGPLTRLALQRYLQARQDGIVGRNTIAALQRRLGASADGIWGPDTTRHLQRALNTGTF